MKIIHTGDWHIGKIVHGIHMTEDQEHVLKGLIRTLENEKPDVLVIAGDIYDRGVPPVEAVDLLDRFLTHVVNDLGIKVIAISGNHDSPDRLGFASGLFKEKGLHIIGSIKEEMSIKMTDDFGDVVFHAFPFVEPALVKHLLGDDAIRTHEEALNAVISSVTKELEGNTRHFAIAHAYVTGGEPLITSESERPLSIGGHDMVDVSVFQGFDYVALGHLHGQQKVRHEHIRYSGSLLKYSFSEVKQNKSVTVIEMGAKGDVGIRLLPLEPIREMRIIKGTLSQLSAPEVYGAANQEDYIMAVLTDSGELVEPMSRLRAIYPNILRMERETMEREAGQELSAASADFANKSPLSLFCEFYENVSGEVFNDEKRAVAIEVLEDVDRVLREDI